jgi:hypothetical protein
MRVGDASWECELGMRVGNASWDDSDGRVCLGKCVIVKVRVRAVTASRTAAATVRTG